MAMPCHEVLENDRMIGPPRSFKGTLVCADSEAKGQASMEGFCRASARQRWRVDRATPRRLAPSRTEIPFTASSFATGTGSDGRPRRFPCARARSRPAIVRSFRRSRSNWLRAARIASWSRPLAEPRSRPSFNETNGTFSDCRSSITARRCFRSRPIRSRAQHTTTWTLARRASRRSRSRPGRRSFAPLISSVYSAWTVQPLASQ